MPSEYDALLESQSVQPKSEYDALLTSPQQEQPSAHPILSGIGAGIWRAIPKSLGEVVGMMSPAHSGIDELTKDVRFIGDVATGHPIEESLKKDLPDIAQQRGALRGEFGTREQAAEITGLGLQAAMLALPFLKGIRAKIPSLRDTVFGKPEGLAAETAAESEVMKNASQKPSTERIPSAQVRPGMDEEAPLRQQGQAPEVREKAQESAVAPVPQPEQPTGSVPPSQPQARMSPVSEAGQAPKLDRRVIKASELEGHETEAEYRARLEKMDAEERAAAEQKRSLAEEGKRLLAGGKKGETLSEIAERQQKDLTTPKIISTAVQSGDTIVRGEGFEPHDSIAARVASQRPSPTQETGKVTPEYEHLKKGIANWYDPNARINAFGKLNDDGSISIPVQRFGVVSTDATRGGTWYELNRGGVSDYNALPETGAAKMVGNVATKYGVGGKERVESEVTTKNPFLVNATKLHEGQYPLELAKKVLSEEEFRKAKRGITGANAEKAYSRLEKLTSQRLQEQGHDAVIFYHKYEYGSIPHQVFKLPVEEAQPVSTAGKAPVATPQGIQENQKGFIIREPDGTERFTNDRGEAARIANAAGQVKPENAGTTELHSQQLTEPVSTETPSVATQPKEEVAVPPETPEALGTALSEKPRLAGPSNRVLQERAARGEIPQAPESGHGILKEDLIAQANQRYSPERAQLAGQKALQGRTTLADEADVVLHEEKLTKAAADAERALKANPTDLALQQAYQTARNAMTDWQHGPIAAIKTAWNRKGINLQGATDVDTGTLVGLQKLAWDSGKGDFTPQQRPIMDEAANRVTKAIAEEKTSILKANEQVQKVLKPSRYMDFNQLRESLAQTLKSITC